MTYENINLQSKPHNPPASKDDDKPHLKRAHSNRVMLDLRQQVQWQSQVIGTLKAERDQLTSELSSRLVFVEGQLRREQKKIEALLDDKDQFIQFQALQIRSLKSLLSPSDRHLFDHHYNGCELLIGSSNTGKPAMACPLANRYSMTINDYGVVSHACPVMVRMDSSGSYIRSQHQFQRPKTLSLPELRDNTPPYENVDWKRLNNGSRRYISSRDSIMDDFVTRRWTSDCESENSDSLDSGISSPSVKTRNRHLSGVSLDPKAATIADRPRRRSPSLDNFIHRALSLSRRSKSNAELNTINDQKSGRDNVQNNQGYQVTQGSSQEKLEQKKVNRFPSSANRNFGTNHRSVTKPRDIKFKKLFKFRRRSDPTSSEGFAKSDYMTV